MLTIIPRAVWRPARRGGPVESRPPEAIDELFVHWLGDERRIVPHDGWSRWGERALMRQIQRQHIQGNGWSDIGYNHVLFPNPKGTPRIYAARGAKYTPAAQKNHNHGTIAIMVYMGAGDTLLPSTTARLRSYVRWADRYAGRELEVRGHGEVVSTECPGPALRKWVKEARHR